MTPGQASAKPIMISAMRREDLDSIMEIERGSHPSPWKPEVFLEELHRGWARVDLLRDDDDGRVLGFINFWLVGDEVHVLNVAVHPEARRRGAASRLLAHVTGFARQSSCRYVTLEVRRGNHGALRLYRRHAFRPVGVRPHYYEDGEDAIVMLLELAAS